MVEGMFNSAASRLQDRRENGERQRKITGKGTPLGDGAREQLTRVPSTHNSPSCVAHSLDVYQQFPTVGCV